MDEKEIRVRVLQKLKESYMDDPHNFFSQEQLSKEVSLPEAQVTSTVRYLEQKGFLDVQWFLGGGFFAKINAFGIDWLDQIINKPKEANMPPSEKHEHLPISVGQRADTSPISQLFESEIIVDVEQKLESLSPDALEKLLLAKTDLTLRDSPHTYNRIAFDMRELLKDLTDALFKPEYLGPGEATPTRNQTKNKLKSYLKNKSKTTESRILAALDYFDAYSDELQKRTHADEFKNSKEDAIYCLLTTYLLIWDILRIQ